MEQCNGGVVESVWVEIEAKLNLRRPERAATHQSRGSPPQASATLGNRTPTPLGALKGNAVNDLGGKCFLRFF